MDELSCWVRLDDVKHDKPTFWINFLFHLINILKFNGFWFEVNLNWKMERKRFKLQNT